MFSAEPLPERVLSANAYLGAMPIAEALAAGADIVITGRCVDSAVDARAADARVRLEQRATSTCSPAAASPATSSNAAARRPAACFTDWQKRCPTGPTIGYPIVECRADGSFVLTKPAGTGGLIAPAPVAEQLLYEIGDPGAYAAARRDLRLPPGDDRSRRRRPGPRRRRARPGADRRVQGLGDRDGRLSRRRHAGDRRHRRGRQKAERTRRRSSSAYAHACCAEAGMADFSATHVRCSAPSLVRPALRGRAARARGDDAGRRRPRRQARARLFAREIAPAGTSWSPGHHRTGRRPTRHPPLIAGRSPSCCTGAIEGSASRSPIIAIRWRSTLHRRCLAGTIRSPVPPTLCRHERGRRHDDRCTADPPRLGAQRRRRATSRTSASIARRPEWLPLLWDRLTPTRVRAWLAYLMQGRGRALLAARHRAISFLLHDARSTAAARPHTGSIRSAGHGADVAENADRGFPRRSPRRRGPDLPLRTRLCATSVASKNDRWSAAGHNSAGAGRILANENPPPTTGATTGDRHRDASSLPWGPPATATRARLRPRCACGGDDGGGGSAAATTRPRTTLDPLKPSRPRQRRIGADGSAIARRCRPLYCSCASTVGGIQTSPRPSPRWPSGRILGNVTRLAVGANVVTAKGLRTTRSFAGATVTVTNHPIGGPVLLGSQTTPWICATPTPVRRDRQHAAHPTRAA